MPSIDPATVYRIIDTQTGQQIGADYSFKSRGRARNRADRLDLAYGASRYVVRPIFQQVSREAQR